MMKLIKSLRKYKKSVIVILALIFCQSISDLYLPNLMSHIVDKGIVNGDTSYILKVGGVMLGVAAIGTACAIMASLISSKVATGFGSDIRNEVFTRVEKLSMKQFNKIGTTSLITRTTNDINQIQQLLIIIFRMMVSAPLMLIGGIIMAMSKDVKLTAILLATIPILAISIFIITRNAIPLFKSMQLKLDKLNLVLREKLSGVRVIRAFNKVEIEKKRFNKANDDLTDTAIKVNKIIAVLMPVMMIILNLTTVAVVWFGAKRIDIGEMQVGDLMAYIQYVMQIMFSLIMVSMMFVMLPRASASAMRINEVLDIEGEIEKNEDIQSKDKIHGYVEFKDVSFAYEGSEEPVIKNVSFSAKPGEVTAIIGSTGSGKSTLIELIPRFYDVTSGNILVDGIDVKNMNDKVLRSKIGFVPQKGILFTGSIADNIRYGKENATEDEIKEACRIAQASEFISEMKDGYDSIIAQGGTNVSGGQKQRICIARALVGKPEVYIFDDSFSALDFKTDAKLRMALKNETKNSTVIIVAQRVSTVIDADKIIVLDEGKIVGMGKHKELLNNCDVYKEIVASQLSEEEIA
ncbi:ABC transporter ATP-binding protein [Clostridium botulinum]|uniref:Multidrug ABC transporter ATP-binding protein n=1 Tax=Clostridium botulinum C/D str. DC5 TaxID=1443128 RepID=A0A0A0ICW3_CLOBO|nr:ABC transporter ATP-binding protein [Clostridium botulinum]KGM99279.1 multidrug ABC transporter ATP-binding protein [Clostridium botulinum C/D str. DC5]KOC55025.1 multidrug ABC transporter ATP-binding protein [Clostridium botulinum]KOC56146.1 multidrug ABC transporter ATP-binding protein [Clostridium botulinum]MCD3233323.1 ABC transporter ATP-binding protein [Clostridium botulinum D/C]MCD3239072.1 ABC transporter ATP-binding protein [Clostridium botulinum D/C]